MFSRSELEVLTIPELRRMCQRYGIRPIGSGATKDNYLTALMAFPALAINQMKQGRGLKLPTLSDLEAISGILDRMNSPTDEQIALIRISYEGRRMAYPARYGQEKLLAVYRAKLLLEEVITLLSPL